MRTFARPTRKTENQRGYALLVVSFMATVMLLTVIAVAPSVRTENQREKEQEMIWRGRQYIRGIKLYYRKNGRFPTSLDDLTKPKTGSIRFMRQAYKDPMNSADGTWRLIYVGPAGQLIGSLKPPQSFQLPGVAGGAAPVSANPNGSTSAFGQSSLGQSSFGQSSFGQSNSTASGFGQTSPQSATQNSSSAASATSQGTPAAVDGSAAPASTFSSDTPMFGGNIIGVGSKIDKRSVIIYEQAKNTHLFEFVWNPSKDLMNAMGQAGTQIGTPNPANQGQGAGSGFGGSSFGQPANNPANQSNQQNPMAPQTTPPTQAPPQP